MSEQPLQLDPENMTAEQFVGLAAHAQDDQLEDVVRQQDTAKVLDKVFEGFVERFVPERAEGVEAVVQFVVTDQGQEYPHTIEIAAGQCRTEPGVAESPKTTMTLGLVPFIRLLTGQAEGTQLFMTGKLKVKGDLLFAARVPGFFEPVKT
jgi:putative sterol carrier protein